MHNPVCGYSNGKQYDNKCELHKEECTMGQVIGVMQGHCKSKNNMSIIQFNLNVSEFTLVTVGQNVTGLLLVYFVVIFT